MKYREKLGYIALGGILMLVGMLAAGLFSPLGAQQNRWVELGNVTCTSLTVVDKSGAPRVMIDALETGGNVEIQGSGDASSVIIFADRSEGDVSVRGNKGGVNIHATGLLAPRFSVFGRGGSVEVYPDENNANLVISDNDKEARVYLKGDEYGGMVGTFDKDDDLHILD